jgi:peptide/nickel transport system substrate-binding protein
MVLVALLVTVMVIGLTWQPSSAETLLRAVLDSGIKQLDPIWTTGYAVRTHGFMVYDTLFGLDVDFNVKPQMVDTYTVSSNKLVYTFTLRSGLKWHDGTPVTSKDCVASIKRWGAKDGIGQKMIALRTA